MAGSDISTRVEQPFIARLQIGEHQILLQIVSKVGDLDSPARDLQVDRGDRRWQQAFESITAPFRFSERGSFIEARVVKQVIPFRLLRRRSGHIGLRLDGVVQIQPGGNANSPSLDNWSSGPAPVRARVHWIATVSARSR